MNPRKRKLLIETYHSRKGDTLSIEVVERKGIGHPDTICDEIAEAVSRSLQRYYLSEYGKVFHYNVDKVLLRAGSSCPKFGAGLIDQPLEVYVCGRATTEVSRSPVPITEICELSVRDWLKCNLRFLDSTKEVRVINLIRPGSNDLSHLFDRAGRQEVPHSNDTSIGVGFSPLSRLENTVLEADSFLQSDLTRKEMPFVGEDIKIMAVRKHEHVQITLACAMVGRFVKNLKDYVNKKTLLSTRLQEHLKQFGFQDLEIQVNAADDLEAGSVYLTVTGTSAEAGDDGEVGRGNRANGLITPCRPMTIEAFAGKNSVSHTGRIYQVWAQEIAEQISSKIDGARDVECLMVSQIGEPINEPQLISLKIDPGLDNNLPRDYEQTCKDILDSAMRQ